VGGALLAENGRPMPMLAVVGNNDYAYTQVLLLTKLLII